MSTEIAVRTNTPAQSGPPSDLAITSEQTNWTDMQKAALHQIGVSKAGDADLAVFFHQCTRTGLDPFARQIYMIERWSKDGPKQTIQTGIDGFRLVARRATDQRRGTLGYEPTLWCGKDGVWTEVWLQNGPPAAAKVTVIRDGSAFPVVALWTEYVGTTKNGDPTSMWKNKGSLMLAKCAEALALRKAFPQDLSGLYTSDEMDSADARQAAPQAATGRARIADAIAKSSPEPEATENPITPKQLKALNTLVSKLGLNRDEKLRGLSDVLGRAVESSSDLTFAEAHTALDSLTKALPPEIEAGDTDDLG